MPRLSVDMTGGSRHSGANNEFPIINEVTFTLKEWNTIWKDLYVHRSPNFSTIGSMCCELIEMRSRLMSGTLPVDESKALKQEIAKKIDHGNAILGLDLVVRDPNGDPLNPNLTSTIELYEAHERATANVKQMINEDDSEGIYGTVGANKKEIKRNFDWAQCYNHNLYVMINNFVCRIGDDADILVALYDGKEMRYISENYVVRWSKQGLMKDLNKLNNLRVLFCDLGNQDLKRERVFLVCQIIRVGSMELKDVDNGHRSRQSISPNKSTPENVRRPFGVAALEITDVITMRSENDVEKQLFVPFMHCIERDSLDASIHKCISQRSSDSHREQKSKDQGLWVSMTMLHGCVNEVCEDNPHILPVTTPLARKMGFPDIILPGDVRNDLYLTLVSADFGSKSCNSKNTEVTVRVYGENGQVISDVITVGAGADFLSEYKSVVYYHEERPKWMETVKISLPIDDFKCSHLKLSFKHRSSNESKDRNEKPFALAYVKLMNENGTTIHDGQHQLLLYKIDNKKFDENDLSYLKLPSTIDELELTTKGSMLNLASSSKNFYANFSVTGLSILPRDYCIISSIVCSTKLTQNIDLLGLLKYSVIGDYDDDDLKKCLLAMMKVDGEEIVKFLSDTLDSLFLILTSKESLEFMDLVFHSLVSIVGLITDVKYQHFGPVLAVYIEKAFSAVLAHHKLISVMRRFLSDLYNGENTSSSSGSLNRKSLFFWATDNHEILSLNVMKSLEFLFKFIVRSRCLFVESRNLFTDIDQEEDDLIFEEELSLLLDSLVILMSPDSHAPQTIQSECLKYLPFSVPDILTVMSAQQLSLHLTRMISSMLFDNLKKQKLDYMLDLVACKCLFRSDEARKVLLPVFSENIRHYMEKRVEMSHCVSVLKEMLVSLHKFSAGDIACDVSDLMLTILRTVIRVVIGRDQDDPLSGALIAIMLSILRLMGDEHYEQYISSISFNGSNRSDLLDFMMELLMVFKDLVSNQIFPGDWCEMIMLMNSVILFALKQFAVRCKKIFTGDNYEYQLWNNFFHCLLAFVQQKSLQLENFTSTKRARICYRYKDMRCEAAAEIRSMWFGLALHGIEFVPDMVGPFLEMALIPEPELRKYIAPIFFEMMQFEFIFDLANPSEDRTFDEGHFTMCANEFIIQMDKLVEGGKGDEEFRVLFKNEMTLKFENHAEMREQGFAFIEVVDGLIKRLLEYRSIGDSNNCDDDDAENRMICIVNLMEFYASIKKEEMYIRYLSKLFDLHLKCENYTEAAYTLIFRCNSLDWSDVVLNQCLRFDKHVDCRTHRELKIALYFEIIDFFEKGQQWEEGIEMCRQLIEKYENDILNYIHIAELHKKMSKFYENIVSEQRFRREYYKVGYYGGNFPSFILNKIFIHRSRPYERYGDFKNRQLNRFPQAKIIEPLIEVDDELMNGEQQYIQINRVEPVMNLPPKFRDKLIHPNIMSYYEENKVQLFTHCRRIQPDGTPLKNSGSDDVTKLWIGKYCLRTNHPLPGILTAFQVKDSAMKVISPIENALIDIEKTKSEIIRLIGENYFNLKMSCNGLLQKIGGTVDAAVNGGITNYERAFLSEWNAEQNADTGDVEMRKKASLVKSIASLIPVLEIGFAVITPKIPNDMKPLLEHLEKTFYEMKRNMEDKYGRVNAPKELESINLVDMARRASICALEANEQKIAPQVQRNSKSQRSTFSQISLRGSATSLIPSSVISATNFGTIRSLGKKQSKDQYSQNRKMSEDSGTTKWFVDEKPSSRNSTPNGYNVLNHRSSSPIIELNEALISQRPYREQVRPRSGPNRLSPNSAEFFSRSISSSALANHLSVDSYNIKDNDSSFDITDHVKPPPLPAKSSNNDVSAAFPTRNGHFEDWTLPRTRKSGSVARKLPSLPSKSSNSTAQSSRYIKNSTGSGKSKDLNTTEVTVSEKNEICEE